MLFPPTHWPTDAFTLSRRDFVASAAALSLCLTGCRPWTPGTRFAYTHLTDPAPGAYRPVLDGLIQAIIPFEAAAFPALTLAEVRTQFLTMFRIDTDNRFLPLQRGLAFFDQVDLFPHPFPAIVDAEDPEVAGEAGSMAAWVARSTRADAERYEIFAREWSPEPATFTALPLPAQRAYLALWLRSSFVVRRQFARSAKALITIAAYSMPALHAAIGYAGPLLEARRDPA